MKFNFTVNSWTDLLPVSDMVVFLDSWEVHHMVVNLLDKPSLHFLLCPHDLVEKHVQRHNCLRRLQQQTIQCTELVIIDL